MKRVDQYWAAFFALSRTEFLKPGITVVPHAGLQGYSGAWLFRRGATTIISAPPAWVERCAAAPRPLSGAITDQDFVALFGDAVERVIGPAYQGFVGEADFHPLPLPAPLAAPALLLSAAHEEALRDLAAACGAEEWGSSGIEIGQGPVFGCFLGERLVAACSYTMWADGVASPGIITHPAYRGQNYGKAVLGAATAHGLHNGFLMLYQTLVANKPAVAAAEALGYQPYATHLAVRLRG